MLLVTCLSQKISLFQNRRQLSCYLDLDGSHYFKTLHDRTVFFSGLNGHFAYAS